MSIRLDKDTYHALINERDEAIVRANQAEARAERLHERESHFARLLGGVTELKTWTTADARVTAGRDGVVPVAPPSSEKRVERLKARVATWRDRADQAEARADKLAKALMYFAQFDREHDGVPDEDTFYGFVGAAQDALADTTTDARDRDTEARDELDADVQQGLRDIEDGALHSFEEAFGEPQVARDRDTEKEEG